MRRRFAERCAPVLMVACALASPSDLCTQEVARVVTLGGDTLSVTALASPSGETVDVTLRDGTKRSFALDELEAVVLPQGRESPAAASLAGRIWLRSGLECAATLDGGTVATAAVRLAFGDKVEIPWVHVQALTTRKLEGEEIAMFDAALTAPQRTEDVLVARARNGKPTRLSLRVLGIEGGDLAVDFRGERRAMPLDQVAAIVFGADNGAPPPAPVLPSVRIDLSDATAWSGRLSAITPDTVSLRLADGPTVAIPLAAVRGIAVRSSRVQWLSSLEPTGVERTAALDLEPFFLRDIAPGGPGLVLGGKRFARGLCMAPRTRVTFALTPGAFAVLETTIGIDERSGGPADAVFRVRLDDVIVFEREHVRIGTLEELRIPLRDARRLTLEVDFGEHFDLGDHCAFGGARLLKT